LDGFEASSFLEPSDLETSPTDSGGELDFAFSDNSAQTEVPESAPAPQLNSDAATAPDDMSFELADHPLEPGSASISTEPMFEMPDSPPPEIAAPESPAPDFDLDTSAPLPGEIDVDVSDAPTDPNKAADDGLEMLSFTDSSPGPDAGPEIASERFQVRRKGGKVFGPFDRGILVNMLKDGQLTGLEDVSLDGQAWSPIGSVPEFQEAIPKLTDAPPSDPAAPAQPLGSETSSGMERLKKVYEGRMATVNVVHGSPRFESLRRQIPMLAAGAGVVIVLALGASLGFTRYGAFGIKRLFPARVSKGSSQATMLEDARKALWADNYKSYRAAMDLSLGVLKIREYPEARAIWSESVFYLQRRYGLASPGELARATASLEEIKILGQKNSDVIKATAGCALAEKRAAQALALLQEATSRTGNSDDLELTYLLAESYAMQGQRKLAAETLNRILARAKGSAKALHALAAIFQAGDELDKAAQSYADALEGDPTHLSSALELASLELGRKNLDKALGLIERLSAETSQAYLAPIEKARASALKGTALALQGKRTEAIAELDQALKVEPNLAFAKDQLARLLLEQREYARAVPLYKEIVDQDGQNLAANEGYLSALIGAGQVSEALAALTQVSTRFPADARIAYLYGRANDAADKAAEAEKHYKRAINSDPKLLEASIYLSHLYLRFRRIDEAKALLEQTAAQVPGDARVHAAIGELAIVQVDLPRARSEFERAVALDPGIPEGHLGLARVAFEEGALPTARTEAEKTLELNPVVKNGRLQHGLVLWKLGEIDAALTELQKAKAEDPKSSLVLITFGAVLLEKGDFPAAETNLLLALTADPLNPEVHFYLAKAKARRGEYGQAIDTMRNALDRAPNRPLYHYELGVIYRDARRGADAIQSWKRAVELDPSYPDSLEALGQAYLDRGEFDAAIASFEQALKSDPKRTRILGLIGDCYFQSAKWDLAIAKYLAALKVDESLKHVYYRLGRAYTEKGRHGQAIGWYTKALEIDRENPMTYYYLGYAYKEQRSRKEAIEAFKTYLALKANAEDKKEIADEIYDLEHD
jgi:tetratricopeptide (TPR) repeat protein